MNDPIVISTQTVPVSLRPVWLLWQKRRRVEAETLHPCEHNLISVFLEILKLALVLFRLLQGFKGSQVASFPGRLLLLSRIEPILAGFQLLYHGQIERIIYWCKAWNGIRNHAVAFWGRMVGRSSAMACSRSWVVLAFTERSCCLSLAHAFSMGLRLGE